MRASACLRIMVLLLIAGLGFATGSHEQWKRIAIFEDDWSVEYPTTWEMISGDVGSLTFRGPTEKGRLEPCHSWFHFNPVETSTFSLRAILERETTNYPGAEIVREKKLAFGASPGLQRVLRQKMKDNPEGFIQGIAAIQPEKGKILSIVYYEKCDDVTPAESELKLDPVFQRVLMSLRFEKRAPTSRSSGREPRTGSRR
jgi:hypothetical protein